MVQNSMDQSIEQLNDVTAVSGVNLRVSFVFPDSFSFHFKSGCVVLNFAVCIDFRKRKNNYFPGARRIVVFLKHLVKLSTKRKKD